MSAMMYSRAVSPAEGGLNRGREGQGSHRGFQMDKEVSQSWERLTPPLPPREMLFTHILRTWGPVQGWGPQSEVPFARGTGVHNERQWRREYNLIPVKATSLF